MKEYSFNAAYSHIRDFYGIELTPDEFETYGSIGWEKIGNRRYKLYLYQTEPTKDQANNWMVELPCNADEIIAVTSNYEDYQKTSNKYTTINMQDTWVEGYIEARKFNTNPNYISGKFVKYWKEGNILKFKSEFDVINILYKGYIADEEGLPFLTTKEIEAVAAFCAWTHMRRNALTTRDVNTFNMAKDLENSWKTLCTQARIPDYITQNEIDEILNVATSWDRKRFGKSFKPIK